MPRRSDRTPSRRAIVVYCLILGVLLTLPYVISLLTGHHR